MLHDISLLGRECRRRGNERADMHGGRKIPRAVCPGTEHRQCPQSSCDQAFLVEHGLQQMRQRRSNQRDQQNVVATMPVTCVLLHKQATTRPPMRAGCSSTPQVRVSAAASVRGPVLATMASASATSAQVGRTVGKPFLSIPMPLRSTCGCGLSHDRNVNSGRLKRSPAEAAFKNKLPVRSSSQPRQRLQTSAVTENGILNISFDEALLVKVEIFRWHSIQFHICGHRDGRRGDRVGLAAVFLMTNSVCARTAEQAGAVIQRSACFTFLLSGFSLDRRLHRPGATRLSSEQRHRLHPSQLRAQPPQPPPVETAQTNQQPAVARARVAALGARGCRKAASGQ